MKPPATPPSRGPDRNAALALYRQRARTYDLELTPFEPLRRHAIDSLALCKGQTVLDVGCGTGLSLGLLRKAVGAQGRVWGIEQCPEMLRQARQRLGRAGRRHVQLICAPAEVAPLTGKADAALLHFTHDILRRPEALDHLLRHLRPGARIVATGLQWAAPWAVLVNLFVWGAAMRSVTSLEGLDRPWSHLAERLPDLVVQDLMLGAVFLAQGTHR